MTKILIVEDEPKAGDYLKQGLREAGYTVDLVTNGVDGLHLGLEGDHDMVILDVMLPGLNGWQILSSLRSQGRHMPVLFLTSKSAAVSTASPICNARPSILPITRDSPTPRSPRASTRTLPP